MANSTIGHIEPFNNEKENWDSCAERFNHYLLANDIEDEKKKNVSVFLTIIGSKTYELPSNLVGPGKPADLKYHELSYIIRIKFRAAVDSGRKSGHGRVVLLYFDKCEDIWGGSPATTILPTGIETSQIKEDVDRLSPGLACSSPANSSIPNTPSTSRPSTPSSSRPSTPSTCSQTNIPSTSRPSTPSTFDTVDGNNSPDHDKDKVNTQPSQATSVKDRRELLNSQLKYYRQERLMRKLSTDAQLLQVVQEDVAIKKRLLEKMEDMDRQQSLQMNKFTTTYGAADGFYC